MGLMEGRSRGICVLDVRWRMGIDRVCAYLWIASITALTFHFGTTINVLGTKRGLYKD